MGFHSLGTSSTSRRERLGWWLLGGAKNMVSTVLNPADVTTNCYKGDLVYMQVFGNPVVFVNSYSIAMDLLDKRSLIYSTRPRVAMMNEL
jgi:hypothetical protein